MNTVTTSNPLTRWPLPTAAVMTVVFIGVAFLSLHLQGRGVDPYRLTLFSAVVFVLIYLRGREQHARYRRQIAGRDQGGEDATEG